MKIEFDFGCCFVFLSFLWREKVRIERKVVKWTASCIEKQKKKEGSKKRRTKRDSIDGAWKDLKHH
ncbi:unnamed protein product [Camellia sinensis]